ncbi:MAG TPA: MDR family MFS transporter [Candidatus Limnocylindrales bacterium]|jgi:EmrB/QacA subfamily drug resistance transporter|nr:MDR family MFS transporter [Candidatus Limnocylindrales bacterium]
MESFPVEPQGAGNTPSVADDPALGLSPRAKLEILGAVLLGLLLGALDQTIVGVALPRIVTELGGQTLYVWSVTIYLLTSTITVPFYGKLSDLYGRKPLLMIGIGLFLLGSALSGLSQDIYQLIAFRGLQGLGAGALFPISLAVIGDLYTPAERGKYQGLFGAVFGLSSIVGPLAGGWLTEHLSWHWIFYINMPVGAIALFIIWRLLPNIRHGGNVRELDYLGGGVFAVAIATLLVGLTNKQTADWSDFWVGGLIGIGAVLFAIFLFIESRAKQPIVPLDLWKNRTYASSIASTFLISFGFFGAVIFLPQWFQFVKGVSPTDSGLQSLALLAGLIFSSIIAGQLVARTGRYKAIIIGGLAIMAVGLFLMSGIQATTDLPVLWLWMFITGVGIGPTLSVFTIVVQNAVPFSKLGVATSNLTFFRQIGGSIGLALLGTAFGQRLTTELPTQLVAAGVPQQFVSQFGGQGGNSESLIVVGQDLGTSILNNVPAQFRSVVEPLIPNIVHGIYQAYSVAVGSVFQIGMFTTIAALAVAFIMKELPLRTTQGHGPSKAPAADGAAQPGVRPTASPALD